jgi:hypothetical protein
MIVIQRRERERERKRERDVGINEFLRFEIMT